MKKAASRKALHRKASVVVAVCCETQRVKMYTRKPAEQIGTRGWMTLHGVDKRPGVGPLLRRIQRALPRLERLLQHYDSHWGYEDPIYRFYHQSWKVYGIEDATLKIVAELQTLAPKRPMDAVRYGKELKHPVQPMPSGWAAILSLYGM